MDLSLDDYERNNLAALLTWCSSGPRQVDPLYRICNTGDWLGQILYKLGHYQYCEPLGANATTEEMRQRAYHAMVQAVREMLPSGSTDSTRRCPLCVFLPNGGNLVEHCSIHAEMAKLRESNEAWHDSQHIWHRCEGGKVRAYPTVLCSNCRGDESANFKAVDALQAAEALADENRRLAGNRAESVRVTRDINVELRQRMTELTAAYDALRAENARLLANPADDAGGMDEEPDE